MTDARSVGTTGVPSFIPAINPLIRRLIGAGMPFGPNVLITIRGRSSGEPHTFPVALVEVDGRRYIQSPFGEVNWVRNLRASGEAVVTKGGHQQPFDALELSPEDGALVLRDGIGRYLRFRLFRPVLRKFFNIAPDSTLEELVAEARLHPMFELRPRAATTATA
jgi:deazaflavin-dependent oxidoreductase (nitroreductase family)